MVLMAQDDDVAVPTLPSGKFDNPIGGGLYLGANRSTVIDSLVCAPLLQDGMKARQTESGSDAGKFQRRTQKRLADAFAVSRVVTPVDVSSSYHAAWYVFPSLMNSAAKMRPERIGLPK